LIDDGDTIRVELKLIFRCLRISINSVTCQKSSNIKTFLLSFLTFNVSSKLEIENNFLGILRHGMLICWSVVFQFLQRFACTETRYMMLVNRSTGMLLLVSYDIDMNSNILVFVWQ